MMELEGFYYYQDEKYATVLIINYSSHIAKKIMNCPPEYCINDEDLIFISTNAATILIDGLRHRFFIIEETNFNNAEPSEKQQRKFHVFEEFNKRYAKYAKYIEEEGRVFKIANDKRMKYEEINEKHLDSLQKCDSKIFRDFINKFIPDENIPEQKRTRIIGEMLKNRATNGYDELLLELKKDKNYVESNELSKQIQPAFMELLEAFINMEMHLAKEYSLFSDEYKVKIDEYADKGLFLYCLNTPELPIDDKDVTIDDIYNYFLDDDACNLLGMFEVFVKFGEIGEVNKREADDLVAAFNLLVEGKYWASLRNLYALIDHHHKLCSDIFNGYIEAKQEFKNGKQRSEYITKLFTNAKIEYYEKVWGKLDSAFEEINKGIGERFVSRNAIVHGDYENPDVDPNAKDVVNVLMLYVTMRMIIDHIKNLELIIKETNIYLIAYETKGLR